MAHSPAHHFDTAHPAVFPVEDLLFALEWSRVAPGLGGWQVAVTEINSGEMVEVTPPGAEVPVFCILPRGDHVELIRERPIEVGGGQVHVGRLPNLLEAVLKLCPLGPQQAFDLERVIDPTVHFQPR